MKTARLSVTPQEQKVLIVPEGEALWEAAFLLFSPSSAEPLDVSERAVQRQWCPSCED